jgi:hypothetical protein
VNTDPKTPLMPLVGNGVKPSIHEQMRRVNEVLKDIREKPNSELVTDYDFAIKYVIISNFEFIQELQKKIEDLERRVEYTQSLPYQLHDLLTRMLTRY